MREQYCLTTSLLLGENISRSYLLAETSLLLHDANCVYCHVTLQLGDQVVVCDECSAPHHQECWQSHKNECATFGCDGGGAVRSNSVSVPSRESAPSPIPQTGTRSPRPAPNFAQPSIFSKLVRTRWGWILILSVALISMVFVVDMFDLRNAVTFTLVALVVGHG